MARLRHIGGRLKYAFKMVWNSAFAPMAGSTAMPEMVKPDEIGVTFIGHSSFLLQMGGKNILIDPVYANWLIVLRRQRRPGVRLKDLPPVDMVLLTHAHMDHLNRPTLKKIVRRMKRDHGRTPVIVVPWGNEDLVSTLGFARVQALRWWESALVGDIDVTLTPCRHWGNALVQGLAPGLWRLCAEGREPYPIRLRRYGVLRRLQGNREAAASADRTPAHWRLLPGQLPHRPHQPGGRVAGVRRPERRSDGADALRHVQAFA